MKRFFEWHTSEARGFLNVDLVTAFRFHKDSKDESDNLKVWFTGDDEYLKIEGKDAARTFEELKILLGREGLL